MFVSCNCEELKKENIVLGTIEFPNGDDFKVKNCNKCKNHIRDQYGFVVLESQTIKFK